MSHNNQYTSGTWQKKPLHALSLGRAKERVLKERGRKCELCGWNKINIVTELCPVDVHHKDGNSKNNTESNLQILCPNCHALTETYKHCRKHSEETKEKIRTSVLKTLNH
jgi:predicted HNH restriction endonuclease